MQPVSISIDVPQSPQDVYAFLDVMANHEQFTDHMLTDWKLSGPATGVGARAEVTAVMGGRSEPVAIEVVEADAPRVIVERNTSAGGKRVAHGTYRLAPATGGGTTVSFEYAWQSAPTPERLTAPLVRALMRRALRTSMQRLRDTLAAQQPATAARAG
jgi:Polyketide cyclase / dehydrase and lipid transport